MALQTSFTKSLSIRYPIASAPMGGEAGGALAAAVSNGGGLGLIGAGRGDREWLTREARTARESTVEPWGIGFLTWAIDADAVAFALEFAPAAIMLSFGDPQPFARRVLDSGAKLILQVTDLEEAHRALDAGADIIVAQGSDAGGHCGENGMGTLSFVPAVVDLAGSTPVLAAGGIADGRGLAAALTLGASGVLIGTRFQATPEALVSADLRAALLDASGADTECNRTLDIARGAPWPHRYPARTLRNEFLDRWRGRDEELRSDATALREYRDALERGDLTAAPVWAGQSVGLVTAIDSARDLVATIAAEAEQALTRATAH
ncbi:nitronate monooxygenase [Nocardia sp. CDC159]|uniref:Nitronate monooxygenase n=1 Tax=Nocardia pulmonis TaxID=2951408 RepID=A0A9X2E6L5_9NOCA|nr:MULTISPECIES: nitronate monooxygenase [Nocardia]MCM6774754.1 nitronate monooxygenase [Nocardia pulmonis]MCM6789685.1 nitronate monooxygenase [Nocardia sp. CDC159]